jgi:hypothetical protein
MTIPATAIPASVFKNHQAAFVSGTGLLATSKISASPFDDIHIHGEDKRIQILPCTTSQKLIGIMRNPIGNQQDEIQRLEAKSNKMAA